MEQPVAIQPQEILKKEHFLMKFLKDTKRFIKTQKIGTFCISFILLFVLVAIFAPIVAPFDPVYQNREAFLVGPNLQNFLGTDDLGRDVFSKIVYGARTSLFIGLASVFLAMIIGVAFGVVSGYFGGWIDMVIQRFMDAILAFPALVLMLFIAALLGPAIENVVIALVIVSTPSFARIVRAEMMRIREEDFVEAARSVGSNAFRIIFRHGLPNMMAQIIIVASLALGNLIIAEASLSFLGIGTPPPDPSWGLMLSEASRHMENAPWLVIFPGLALSSVVLAFNIFGDTLRDFLDPRMSS